MILAHFKNVYKQKSMKFIKQINHSLFFGVFKNVIDDLSEVKTRKKTQ